MTESLSSTNLQGLGEDDNDATEHHVRMLNLGSAVGEQQPMMSRLRQAVQGTRNPEEAGLRKCSATVSMRQRIPMLRWVQEYTFELLRADLTAGITVGVVLIPQGMAYAMLAELPAIYGLYASLIPLPIYAAMCSSRHMSIGPFALVSLLVADTVAAAGYEPEHEEYIPAVRTLSLMVDMRW